MKRGQIALTGFVGAIPIACGMLVSVGTFPTSFQIHFSLLPLILICTAAALLLSFWMVTPRYGFGFGALYLAGLILLIVFCFDQIREGAVAFLNRMVAMAPKSISGRFNIPALENEMAGISDPDLSISLMLSVVAVGIGLPMADTLLRSKASALALLIPLPTVMASFLYTDQPPALWTVILLCVYCGFALLGKGFRRGESPERGRFLATLVPVFALFAALLLWVVPQKNYEAIPEQRRQQIFSDLLGDLGDRILDRIGNGNPTEVTLKMKTNWEESEELEFSVRSDHAGAYYLRVHSYGAYGEDKWQQAAPYDGEWHSMEALGSRQSGETATMELRTSFTSERIVPYAFLADGVEVEESAVPAKTMRTYSWTYRQNYRIERHSVTGAEREYYRFAAAQYTMPDGPEREALLALANQAGVAVPENPESNPYAVYNTAVAVAHYVRVGRDYTLSPEEPPQEADAVLYFLTQGNEGYCKHFASATTAMLQALGIPARYTNGYYVPDISSDWKEVTAETKHAWAEIYLMGVGWVPIESTPNFPENQPLVPQPQLSGGQEDPGKNEGPVVNHTPIAEQTEPETPLPLTTPTIPSGPQESVPVPETNAPQLITDEPVEPEPTQTQQTRNGAWWLLLIPVPFAIWASAGILVRKRREAVFADANAHRAIPEMAYYLKRLERYGISKDPDAERWASEAAFSDHPMKAERKELLKRIHTAQNEIRKNKPLTGFALRWIRWIL